MKPKNRETDSPHRLSTALAALLLLAGLGAGCRPATAPVSPAAAAAAVEDLPPGTADLYEEVDVVAGAGEQFAEVVEPQPLPYVLKGTLLLPDGPSQGGLLVEDGRIVRVWKGSAPPAEAAADIAESGAVVVDTGGIVLPGFVDLHNHVAYNFLPFWHSGRLFDNRYVWQGVSAYKKAVSTPYGAAKNAGLLDEMVKFSEIRGLVGGTTSILGAAVTSGAGILARNIDQKTLGSDKIRTNVGSVLEFGCDRGKPRCPEQAGKVAALKASLAGGSIAAMVFHVAEGKDELSRAEFDWLEEVGLLVPQVVVTHGVGFGAAEFAAMAEAGMPLVWSPRSNVELYGQTADVVAARTAGVRIVLAPDWSPSGSDNLLGELRYAARYNHEHLDDLLSAKELVEMATSLPAEVAGRGAELGRLEEGFVADLVVLERPAAGETDPYASVVAADERHVKLVAVNGVPLYGLSSWLDKLGKQGDHERIRLRGRDRALDADVPESLGVPKGTQSWAQIRDALAAAYDPFGTLPELTANDD